MNTIVKQTTDVMEPMLKTVKSLIRSVTYVFAGAMCATALAAAGAGNSGQVLPPSAEPHGYSIADMASAVANFSISGNDPAYYPQTPFQILYRKSNVQDPTGANTFIVKPGTFIYAKFFFIDDSAPIIGDWPADPSGAADYIFGRDQIGANDLKIVVDGRVTSLDDADYIGGPVATPNSPDGGQHMIQIGAFVSPLSKGIHHVTLSGTFDGEAFVNFVGIPITLTSTYTIIVQ